MMDLINHLQNLRLDSLDCGWAKAVSQSEYLDFEDLPPEYENAIDSLELESTFMNIIRALDSWLEADTEDNSWAYLSQTIDHMKLLALIGYYIDYGCKNVRTREYRLNALLASRVYFKLLRIPGYKTYNIYHSQLFVQSLTCLSFPTTLSDEETNYTSSQLIREINCVLKHLDELVDDMKLIVKNLHLTPNDTHFEEILNNSLETSACAKLHIDKILLTTINAKIIKIIDIVLSELKTNQHQHELAVRMLFKCILSRLVAASMDNTPSNKNVIRPNFVMYSVYLMSNYAQPGLSSYTILVEHLCYTLDGLEKTEVREIRADMIIGIMSLLNWSTYKKITKWILQLSKDSKLQHRQLAVEILAKMLAGVHNGFGPTEQPTENNDAISPDAEDPNGEPQPSTSTANNKSKQNSPETFIITDDTSQCSLESGVIKQIYEEPHNINTIICARKHNIPHMEVIRALYERVHDESGTLRTRVISILNDCLQSEHQPVIDAVKTLQGEGSVSRLTAVAARAVCDERATVRKAGVGLMLQLLLDPASDTPRSEDLVMLVSLCRDGSLVVRQAAINAIGDLVTAKPCESVIEAFLAGPVHQVSDPEGKVQEQVLSLIEYVLIDRLKQFKTSGCDPLPWMILAGMVKQKMKMHLQKVCVLLSKKKCLNHRLVDKLSTHLGALNKERDLQCLVLLTSLARHVECSELAFLLDYYYKLVQMDELQDVRLMSQTLELLSLWSRFLSPEERTSLRHHIVRRLVEAQDDGCRILRAKLAAQLDPDNLIWATEMMQMSEQRAILDCDVSEALRAADLSLVAPIPPSPGLLQVFLHAINDALPECESESAAERGGACVAGAARLCVRSRAAAAAAAPTFAALLAAPCQPLPVRINSLVALSDICARYTCIVEPLLGTMCDCLSKESPVELRRRAARELTRLLLGGFLRLRTPLYYRYCALLADEDIDVREPAEYYMSCSLTSDTIYHHFVDCLLHYNHNDKDRINFDSRQLIYDVMLQRLSMVQRLNIQCRLAREVLEHAADLMDEDDELSPAMNAALLDTTTLLTGPRLKLPKKPQKASNLEELQERVTTNIVSRKMKMTVAEVLVPAVIKLYSRMKPRGGQSTTYLLQLSTDLVKDYESEIEEVFEDDRELMKQVKWFQESIGMEPRLGNVRNLVTRSAPPEPDTPRSSRRRARVARTAHCPRKRALRV
ncbi:condensin-2 complex subunit D3 isoform X1 [Spodoptera frugiperda]|uniref:Condensin-2 complex subunit D3 isoform X1 n=1 Tax=Spodoptera frugiperda TaxID=7108 RepID=A0A9R0CYE2_SPOFR|nr:condensin-2 complex subunit D3 isoform X1 [Spodoptera frugiperda]